MRTIFTDKLLKPQDKVVFSPTSQKGDQIRIVKRNSLAHFMIAVCVGGVKALMTPSQHGRKENAHKGYKKFVVKE